MPKDYRNSPIIQDINKEVWDEVYRIIYRLLEVFANSDNTKDTTCQENLNQIIDKSLLKDHYKHLWSNLREIEEFPTVLEIEKIKEIFIRIYDHYKNVLI